MRGKGKEEVRETTAGSRAGPRAQGTQEEPHLEDQQVLKPVFCAVHRQSPDEEADDDGIGNQ
jgi:hypothetical protein